ncbi:unnamed protein product, partial [Ectocarpus sp. 12 AP-2014]
SVVYGGGWESEKEASYSLGSGNMSVGGTRIKVVVTPKQDHPYSKTMGCSWGGGVEDVCVEESGASRGSIGSLQEESRSPARKRSRIWSGVGEQKRTVAATK